MPKALDLTNQKFNRLTVIKPMLERTIDNKPQWLCKCDCGKFTMSTASGLRSGNVKSCGCLHRELVIKRNKENATHGFSRTPIYQTWGGMITRCYNENDMHYQDYGARGITVCKEWLASFENFYKDMGDRPSNEYSLDRKDNDGNYEPNNCKWSTRSEQQNNKRNTVIVEYLGEKYTMVRLCQKLDIDLIYFRNRYYRGFTIEEIVNTYNKKKE